MQGVQRLSDLIAGRFNRRKFLAGLSIATSAVALEACQQGNRASTSASSDTTGKQAGATGSMNSNSRLDTAVVHEQHANSIVPGVAHPEQATFRRYDPTLMPLEGGGKHQIHFHSREAAVRISPDTVISAWTFEGDVPGPIVHVREGDTVEFTLTNDGMVAHSMDFHVAQINPKDAFKSVAKGQSITFTFKPRFAGAFMYHCGTAPVLMHIGSGMFGAIIVRPRKELPAAKEFVLVQNEYYLGTAVGGVMPLDYRKMTETLPDVVCFNGRPDQYIQNPIKVKVGDRVRFWVVSAGPTHPCNFHVVGEQFDTVYLGAPPENAIRGVQTFSVPPGGGMVFDLIADIPGEFPFVNHGFGHGQKGAIGFLSVAE